MTLTNELIASRLQASKVPAPAELVAKLAKYLETLGRWNRRLNLTALPLDPPSAAAVDRLIVEPVAAAAEASSSDRVLVDVGSGGGSPALPLKLACPWLRLVMVESKVRKAAFLREQLRVLDLATTADVQQDSFRDVAAVSSFHSLADVISIRAVRVDDDLLVDLARVLKESGRVFQFVTDQAQTELPGFELVGTRQLVAGQQTQLRILRRRD